ncbi:hypothetical protein POM88_010376 [Heracleum sosnowskyi]|uniref:Bidirectional sugar transporter SWEET n=1 Tax=Heracleum sosnowskyi TaxID=360622 RepID=A0AAD8MVP8_9APIA|nr:hypothetical protein POM88_010376 [Heracleum sosnowskyi]
MTFNCLLWALYGLPFINPGNFLLLTAYGTGVAIHIAYLAIFLLYARRQRMCVVSVILIELLVIALVFGVVIGLNHTFDSRSFTVGFLMGTIGSGMLVVRQRLAVRTAVQDKKCAKWMPFLIALSDPLNNLCWCIYAALGSDRYLTIITGIGFVMTLYQLIRYCVYGSSSTPKSFDAEKLPETADKEISQAECDKKVPKDVTLKDFSWRENALSSGSGPVLLLHMPLHLRANNYQDSTMYDENPIHWDATRTKSRGLTGVGPYELCHTLPPNASEYIFQALKPSLCNLYPSAPCINFFYATESLMKQTSNHFCRIDLSRMKKKMNENICGSEL